MVNNPPNAALTPGPGISLETLSNSFNALTVVSFTMEWLVGAVSKPDVVVALAQEIGAATEVAMLYMMSDTLLAAERSTRGVRDGV